MQLNLFQNRDILTVTTITVNVALAIGGPEIFNQIQKFAAEANENNYTLFTHKNFFYSYPVFGKSWKNKDCEFHRVNTKCHLCDYMPERNYAGYGHIYVLNNGICNPDILVRDRQTKKWDYVPNTPRLSRMILLCQDHIKGYFEWKK
jgi:hypothetical protein